MQLLASCISWIFDDVHIHHPEFHSLMHLSHVQPWALTHPLCFERTSDRGPRRSHTPIISINSAFQSNNIHTTSFICLFYWRLYGVWTAFWQPLKWFKVPKRLDVVWVVIYFMFFFLFWELSQNKLNVWPQTVDDNHCFLSGCRWRWMM